MTVEETDDQPIDLTPAQRVDAAADPVCQKMLEMSESLTPAEFGAALMCVIHRATAMAIVARATRSATTEAFLNGLDEGRRLRFSIEQNAIAAATAATATAASTETVQ